MQYNKAEVILKLGGLDLVDGTPVFDIKPYLPYSNCYPDALASYAASAPEPALSVMFSCEVQYQLHHYAKEYPQLTNVISHVLSQDPRPAYKKSIFILKGITLNCTIFPLRGISQVIILS